MGSHHSQPTLPWPSNLSTPACLAVAGATGQFVCRGDTYADAVVTARWSAANCGGAFTGCVAPTSVPASVALTSPPPGVVRPLVGTCAAGSTYWPVSGGPPIEGECAYARAPTDATCTGQALCAADAAQCDVATAAFCSVTWSK
jgi:hypothetical protein